MERSYDFLTPTVQHGMCDLLKNWQLNRWGKNNITLEEQKLNLKKKPSSLSEDAYNVEQGIIYYLKGLSIYVKLFAVSSKVTYFNVTLLFIKYIKRS